MPAPFVVETYYSRLAQGTRPKAFVAETIFPVVPVDEKFTWYDFENVKLNRVRNLRTSRDADIAKDRIRPVKHVGFTSMWGHGAEVVNGDADSSADPTAYRSSSILAARDQVLLSYEQEVANYLTDDANYEASLIDALTGAQRFDNTSYDSIVNPEDRLRVRIITLYRKQLKLTGFAPNLMVMPMDVALVLATLDEILKERPDSMDLTQVLGLPREMYGMSILIPGVTGVQKGAIAQTDLSDAPEERTYGELEGLYGNDIYLIYSSRPQALTGNMNTRTHGITARSKNFQVTSEEIKHGRVTEYEATLEQELIVTDKRLKSKIKDAITNA